MFKKSKSLKSKLWTSNLALAYRKIIANFYLPLVLIGVERSFESMTGCSIQTISINIHFN